MDSRRFNVFAATFGVAAVVALGGWFAVDFLVNLDEYFQVSDSGGDALGAFGRHYVDVITSRGGLILAPILIGSGLLAAYRSRRVPQPRPGR